MSSIKINEKNLSRFTKRLQKSIEKNLGHAVSLNVASLIFSQSLGSNSFYDLQQILKVRDSEPIIDFINKYFQENLDSRILSFDTRLDMFTKMIKFNFTAFVQANNDIGGLSIFISQAQENLSYELKKFSLLPKDRDFLENLVTLLNFNDMKKNLSIGYEIQQELNIVDNNGRDENSYYSFKKNEKYTAINNYGICENFIVLLKKNFLEKLNENNKDNHRYYSLINLENEEVVFFESIQQALPYLSEETVLLDFITLLGGSSYKKQGLCHYSIYKEGDKSYATIINNVKENLMKENGGIYSVDYHAKKSKILHSMGDYYYFTGMLQAANMSECIDPSLVPPEVNHPYYKEFVDGYYFAQNKVEVKKLLKKV